MNNINIEFTIILKKSCQYIINQQQLQSLIRHRYSLKKELFNLPINYLLSILLQSKSLISNPLHYYIIKNRIVDIIKQKYNHLKFRQQIPQASHENIKHNLNIKLHF
mgnify:CR=1 FL=1